LEHFEHAYIDWGGLFASNGIYEANSLCTDAAEFLGSNEIKDMFSTCKQFIPG
jgi:hypothetical protein